MPTINYNYYPDGWTIVDRNAKFDSVNLFHKGLIPVFATGFGSGTYIDWFVMILRLNSSWWNQYYNNTTCAPGSACRTNLGSFMYEFPKESNNVPVEFIPGEWIEGSTFTIGKVGIWGPEQSQEKRYWGFFGLVPDTTIYSIDMHTGFNIAIPENADSFCNDSYDLLSGISRDFVTGEIFNYNVPNGILFGISTSPCTFYSGAENFVLVVKSNGILYRGHYPSSIDVGAIHNLSVRSFQGNTILAVNGTDRVTVPAVPLGKLKPLWGIASFSDNTTYQSSPEVYFKNINIVTLLPSNIISTALTVNTNSCYSPCTITGSVTWTNNGDTVETFNPAILVNGDTISLGTNVPIDPNISNTITLPFSLLNYTVDTYNICASPGTHCQTVNITTCVPNWQCRQPLDGYEQDINNCGEPDRLNPICNPCVPNWQCRQPLDGYEQDINNCGEPDRLNPICNAPIPANIIATTIIPSSTICFEPCDITVEITWTNTGETTGSFIPSIKIDDIPISPEQYSSEELIPEDITTHIFIITGLTEGNHTICATPSTIEMCTTITVTKVVEAGLDNLGMFVAAGILLGSIFSSDECKKHKTKEECEKADCQWKDGRCIKRK